MSQIELAIVTILEASPIERQRITAVLLRMRQELQEQHGIEEPMYSLLKKLTGEAEAELLPPQQRNQ